MNFRHTLTPTFLFIIFLVSTLAPALMIRETEAQEDFYPRLYVTPSVAYAEPGQTVSVSIMIANVFSLWSYQVFIEYSPDIVEIVRNESTADIHSPYAYYLYQGDFLKRGAYNTFWLANVNNTRGELQAWEAMVLPSPDTSGNGELFRVVFRIKQTGASILDLNNTALATKWNVPIPHKAKDGAVTTAALGISPSLIKGEDYPPDSYFDVNVSLVGSVKNVYGFDLNITYGTEVLNVTSVTLLSLLEMPNSNSTEINYTEGRIRLSVNCTAPASPINTTGPMATLTFRVLPSEQKTDIDIVNSTLTDVFGNDIIHLATKAVFTGGLIRNVGIREATLSSYDVTAGDNITVTINAYNNGTRNETFTITVHAINNITILAGGPSQYVIESNQTKTLTLTMYTYGLGGNYTIYVNMSWVPDETITEDNLYAIPSMLSVTPKAEPTESPFGTTFYIAITLIIIVVVAALLFYYLRRKR
jgi:hypothetical protein